MIREFSQNQHYFDLFSFLFFKNTNVKPKMFLHIYVYLYTSLRTFTHTYVDAYMYINKYNKQATTEHCFVISISLKIRAYC
jgi:hypothetical protein